MAAALFSPDGSGTARLPLTPAPHLACSAPPIPDGPCPVCPRPAQEFEPWRQASYWKAMHDRAQKRQDLPRAENERLRARLRLREQQPFGKKTEAGAAPPPTATRPGSPPRRPRG